jgi:hypothetical protein
MSPQIPFNLSGIQPATGIDYPPGPYIFTVAEADIKANKDGQGQHVLIINEIVMGPGTKTDYQGKKLYSRYQITEAGMPFLKRMILACGISEAELAATGGAIDTAQLVGRQYFGQVVKNNQYTNITQEKPISEWQQNANGGAAGQQSAATPGLLSPLAAPVAPQMFTPPQPPVGLPPQQPMVPPAQPGFPPQQPGVQPQQAPQQPLPPQGVPQQVMPPGMPQQPQQPGVPQQPQQPQPPAGNQFVPGQAAAQPATSQPAVAPFQAPPPPPGQIPGGNQQ